MGYYVGLRSLVDNQSLRTAEKACFIMKTTISSFILGKDNHFLRSTFFQLD